MILSSQSFAAQQRIPATYAYGQPGGSAPCVNAPNRNPHLAWAEPPDGTLSFALICVDSDAPSEFGDANQAGRHIAARLPRQDFFHWVMLDIAAICREIAEGACSDGVVAGGKKQPPGPPGSAQGLNDYGLSGGGDHFGYDGPCPPWNDELLHRYHFRLFALSVPTLGLSGRFTAPDAYRAMQGKILAEATLTGIYSLNPTLA